LTGRLLLDDRARGLHEDSICSYASPPFVFGPFFLWIINFNPSMQISILFCRPAFMYSSQTERIVALSVLVVASGPWNGLVRLRGVLLYLGLTAGCTYYLGSFGHQIFRSMNYHTKQQSLSNRTSTFGLGGRSALFTSRIVQELLHSSPRLRYE